jgi:hypothetical protein
MQLYTGADYCRCCCPLCACVMTVMRNGGGARVFGCTRRHKRCFCQTLATLTASPSLRQHSRTKAMAVAAAASSTARAPCYGRHTPPLPNLQEQVKIERCCDYVTPQDCVDRIEYALRLATGRAGLKPSYGNGLVSQISCCHCRSIQLLFILLRSR